MKNWLCKITFHLFRHQLLPSHISTIEDGKKKLWVVMVCPGCKVIRRIGLAHESEAHEETKVSEIPDDWKMI